MASTTNNTPTALPLRSIRIATAAVMLLLLGLSLLRLACLDGLFRNVRVSGGSMAMALCGDHFRVTCGDCGIVCPAVANGIAWPAANEAATLRGAAPSSR